MMDSLELDVSLINSEEEIVERLREKANPKAILSVTLKGVSALGTDFKKIIDRVRECVLAENMFFHLLWEDRTMVPFELKVDEKTARGLFIKKMEQKIKDAQEEKKRVYELALQIGVKAIDEGRI